MASSEDKKRLLAEAVRDYGSKAEREKRAVEARMQRNSARNNAQEAAAANRLGKR